MRIGIFGATIYNHNLGCQALSWSMFTFLENVAEKLNTKFEYIVFDRSIKEKSAQKMCTVCGIDRDRIKIILGSTPKLYKVNQNTAFIRAIKECECVIDITQGDSFSDIYGEKRFYTWTVEKRIVQKLGISLILGPQTYGPFMDKKCEKYAVKVINEAEQIISRDDISTKYLESISRKNIVTGIDVAFLLPYQRKKILDNGKTNVGINPSGLIWKKFGCESEKLDLSYKTNYREFLKKLLDYLCDSDKYNVFIVPHVSSDEIVTEWIKEIYPAVQVFSMFEYATDAKNVIASMDCFIGTRMHATIAAMSSGVPVIPVSYSRKFEGLYSTLNYKYCVSLENMETEECLNRTIEYLKKLDVLKADQQEALVIADNKLNVMKTELSDCLSKRMKK